MASIAGFRPWARWTLAGLIPKRRAAAAVAVEVDVPLPALGTRRSYAPPRDAFLETSAMRREMYRL